MIACVFNGSIFTILFNHHGKGYADVAVILHGGDINGLMKILLMEIYYYWFCGNQQYTEFDENETDEKRKSLPRWMRGRTLTTHQKEYCKACSLKVYNKIVVGE